MRGLERKARSIRRPADVMRGGIRQSLDTTNLALIETDTAERAEAYQVANSVLVGNLDPESLEAARTPCAIKVQERTEHDRHSKDARRDRYVAVRRAEVPRHSEERHGGYGNEAADSQASTRALRPSLEVFPDRHACHDPDILPRASYGRARGGIDVNEAYRTIERSGTAEISPAETGRVHGPKRSGNRRVWPVALHRRIKTDSAARTRGNSRP